ncbi:hypothetical protein [Acinetobacter bouvetii]|uniref:Uncharacterized protein n=1 Tax=Acinetobacter bouvetii TaxID=202951 RepID=A0A811G6T2_9GAMM|nr:hypothetical protein [Acinetobacter bouvetii]CAB1209770.1 hypothetical protein SFB21_0610 [Acinetobacter bouvetii]
MRKLTKFISGILIAFLYLIIFIGIFVVVWGYDAALINLLFLIVITQGWIIILFIVLIAGYIFCNLSDAEFKQNMEFSCKFAAFSVVVGLMVIGISKICIL